MSGAVISSNVSLKVNRAITGATTVSSNCYAEVSYYPTSIANSASVSGQIATSAIPITRIFGPAQSIPATFTSSVFIALTNANIALDVTYTLLSGVEFINSP
jgi:hypothetical protein